MARLSKTSPFQIYNDSNTNSETLQRPDFDESVEEQEESEKPFAWTRKDDGFVTESDEERIGLNDDGAQEGDDEKNYTRTSISSFPESNYPTDYERTPMHKPYTPQYVRPSSRRMQMSSPLRKGRFGTPYSEPKGSPRSRRKDFDADNDSHELKPLPLILLHITTLPMNISWSHQTMRETLPRHILDNLQLLKSKLSATVLKRGILIPHPRDDYELLEEKLLEALELQEPRISKCGHYRNRHSTDSTATNASSSPDSGVGSSVDESDEEHCSTCHHHLQAAGSGKQKWSIKVYAANGLMRASAWHAAWSEMERVDVEIMPWIKDELRITLDEANRQELSVAKIDPEADELRINQLVEERLKALEEDTERAREAEMSREIERIVINEQRQISQAAQETSTEQVETAKHAEYVPVSEPTSTELPNIYRPKDIPLSILLRNYVFLLARKPRNMAMFFLVILITGLLAIIGPAPMAAAVSNVSALVMPKTTNGGVPRDTPGMTEHPVLRVLEVSAQAEDEANVLSDNSAEAGIDTVTLPESVLMSEKVDYSWTEEISSDAELVGNHVLKDLDTLTDQVLDSKHMADKVTWPQTPDMMDTLNSPSDLGVSDSMSVDSMQAEQIEDRINVEQSEEAGTQPEILSAPADVNIKVASVLGQKDDGSLMAPNSPHVEQLEKCLPQPAFSNSPASCDLSDEVDDKVGDRSLAERMHQSAPHYLFSGDPAVCRLDDELSALTT